MLHVGLPKTGSSALQIWCDRNREALRDFGVDYPRTDQRLAEAKHQFLVAGLQMNRLAGLQEILSGSTAETIVMSAEGLTNHLYDFRPAACQTFRELTDHFTVIVFMVARETDAWTRSYYKQSIINPPVIPGFHWATSLLYHEFCALPRVQRLRNISALEEDLRSAFGASAVVVAQYEGDWMAEFQELLGIRDGPDLQPLSRENISLPDEIVELVRQVNALGIPPTKRAGFVEMMSQTVTTNHNATMAQLSLFYPDLSVEDALDGVDNILTRLTPTTPTQIELIERMRLALQGGSGRD